MAAGFRTIILAGFAIGGVGGVVLPDLKFDDAVPIQDRRVQALSINAEPFSALDPMATAEPGPADLMRGRRGPRGGVSRKPAKLPRPTFPRRARQNLCPCRSRR